MEYDNFVFYGRWYELLKGFDESTAKEILWQIMLFGTSGEIATNNQMIRAIIKGAIECNITKAKDKYNASFKSKKKSINSLKQNINTTEYIIQNYLIRDQVISFNELKSLLDNADEDRIAEYIQTMNYKDFLNSPYWKAIAKYRKYKANYKCCVCGNKQNLNVHHNTYEHHGYEHKHSYIMSDLTVLCNECHKKFHLKENNQLTT